MVNIISLKSHIFTNEDSYFDKTVIPLMQGMIALC